MNITNILQTHFNIQPLTIKQLVGESDLNYYIQSTSNSYILKIARYGKPLTALEMQNEAMLYLQQQSISYNTPTVVANNKGQHITTITDDNNQPRLVRLLTWLDGRLLVNINPHTPTLLTSLGKAAGNLCHAFKDFKHPYTHRTFLWDNRQIESIEKDFHFIKKKENYTLVKDFFSKIKNDVLPHLSNLRQQVIHNDLNDYNVVGSFSLDNPTIIGMFDFGDMIHTNTINELANTCAYAMLHKHRPIAAASHIIKGFNSVFPLQEDELQVLFHLIIARLLISVTVSSKNAVQEPDNEYLLISQQPAWRLLRQLQKIAPNFAYYAFRDACGLTAHPNQIAFENWATSTNFHPIMGFDITTQPYKIFDLSVSSTELGNNSIFEDNDLFDRHLQYLMWKENVTIGIGKYNEIRPIYTTDNYLVTGDHGPEWRTVHLGIDVFMKAEQPIFAPFDGIVHSFQDNAIERDYGPTIILQHTTTDFTFYTLYGHLSRTSLKGLKVGQSIKKGAQIAKIGPRPENGDWNPHLHFQILLDTLNEVGNFPGVAFPNERAIWTSICPDPNLIIGLPHDKLQPTKLNTTALLTNRQQYLGKNLSISYKKNPLNIVRGYGQYLYTADGRRYLDTRNNVPHVGHQHPKVVEAAQRQIAVLNTNTRYLYEQLNDYATALLATFPDPLQVVYFVNSGSEANELALRIAKTVTQQRDMLAIEIGYHGNTGGCIDVSSYKFDGKGGQGAPKHTHILPIPDTYRGIYKGEDAGKKYAAYAQTLIEKIEKEGRSIAGFIAESILSCGGQIVLPKGYLQAIYKTVRAKGGLCIDDEVQVGFGRVGKHFWGFQLHDVIPDIVTMGKPIGNGHPLGAVVTTRAIADAFANGMEYFNTYGGNPVSMTIGHEVLKIVQQEDLQAHALEVGNYILKRFEYLKSKYPIVGDSRGVGLFSGFELVKNRTTLEPATEQANYLATRMRELGVLISTDGKYDSVIKIKPPMVFSKKDADFMIEKLEQVLQEDFMVLV